MIHIDDTDGVRVVTLDRPERRNALTEDGLDDLRTAIEACPGPVAYLRGAGESFCAGADLSTVADAAAEGAAAEFIERGQATADAIENTDTVVVAGIDGPARGGGVELALACDIRVATPTATLGEPGVTFGLFGAWGGTVRLPEVVGLGAALDFSLSGRVLDAEEAKQIGLVSRVCADPRSVAESVADNDPLALEHLKRRLRDRAEKSAQQRAEREAFETLAAAHADRLQDLQ